MKRLLTIAGLALFISFGVAGARQAEAISTAALYLSDGVTTVIVTDGGAFDTEAAAGVVGYSGSIGAFSTTVSTGVSRPQSGASNQPVLDLNSVEVSGTSVTSTLRIMFTDTGFTTPLEGDSWKSFIGGTTDGAITYSTYYDNSNVAFGGLNTLTDGNPLTTVSATNTLISTFTPTPHPDFFYFGAGELKPLGSVGTNYALTMVVDITHTSAGQITSFDAGIRVPEPSTLLLLGSGLLGLGFIRRKLKV